MPTYDDDGALLISLAGVVLDHEHSAPGDGGPLAGGVTLTDLTVGSVWFAGAGGLLQEDNANLFWDDGNNRLGVGTNAPADELAVEFATSPVDLLVKCTGVNSTASVKIENDAQQWRMRVVGGSGDRFELRDTTGAAAPIIVAAGAPTDSIRIIAAGVGINKSAPAAQLHVDQSSGTGAKPVLTLEQADVDYVLAKIVATAAAASADRTLVADSDFGTPGALVGWIQIEIQDDGNRVADADYYIPFYAVPT